VEQSNGANGAEDYKLVTVGYVANVAHTSAKTVQRWAEDGLLRHADRVNGDMWVFDREYIDSIADVLRQGKRGLLEMQGGGVASLPQQVAPAAATATA